MTAGCLRQEEDVRLECLFTRRSKPDATNSLSSSSLYNNRREQRKFLIRRWGMLQMLLLPPLFKD